MGIMVYEWKNKVVLISGAATGIGALLTRYLMKEGVKHVAVLDINEKAGKELAAELNGKHGANKVKFYKCDVTNDDQFLGSFDAVVKDQGGLDVVVNNAGIMNDGKNAYKKEIAINVTALVTGTIKALELMGKDKGGKGGTIINISSIAGLCQSFAHPVYFATKSAVLQFSLCVGMEEFFAITGVRVLIMCFGATDTPLLHVENVNHFNESVDKDMGQHIAGFPLQKIENAVEGMIEAYKQGETGSTWLSANDRPVEDISANVTQAYGILSKGVFE